MKPAVVVDVGNTRIKWGRCADDRVTDMASLAHDDEAAWRRQMTGWQIPHRRNWASAACIRAARPVVRLARRSTASTVVVESHRQLPLHVDVDMPDKVGLDRLLNAVAVNRCRSPVAGGVHHRCGNGGHASITSMRPDVSGRRDLSRACG